MRIFKRALAAVTSAACLTGLSPTVPLTASAEKIIVFDGYDYEYWSDNGESERFDIGENGELYGSWHTDGNCFFAKGIIQKKPASNNYTVSYDISINFGPIQNASAFGANTYLCAYGTLADPAAEIFLIDYASYPEQFEDSKSFTPLGSFVSDGSTYDLYVNKGVVNDVATGSFSYDRYFSVRRDGTMKDRYADGADGWDAFTDYKGEINVGAQLDAIEKLGKKIGDLDRLSFNVESFRSSGDVILNSCELTENKKENDDLPKTSGSFERKGGTYSYSSSCRPSKLSLNVYKEANEKEFDLRWPDGINSITKSFISEPVKIGANDVILLKEDYSFELTDAEAADTRFSGIFEMDLNSGQKVYLVDTGLDFSEKSIADMYAEKGIKAEFAGRTDGKNTIKLRETIFNEDKREMDVYPFTYTVKNGDTDEKHTDYWIADHQNDTYSYRSAANRYSGRKIVSGSSFCSYNIHNAADIFKALKEYGLSADTVNSASFTFSSGKTGGSLEVNELTLNISHFPDGPYYYSAEHCGEGDFSLKPSENGLFDFDWYNKKYGSCQAESGKHFDGSGLELENVDKIVADYSVTVDSVQIYGEKEDLTSVYLYGKLPAAESITDEFRIDIAYLGNDNGTKNRTDLPVPSPVIEDNGRSYDLFRNKDGYVYTSSTADEYTVGEQYWSMEHEPPVNGEEPAEFNGTIDITKHIAAYTDAGNGNKYKALSDLVICADARRSTGVVSVGKFDITITYKDGTVEKYTPCEVERLSSEEARGDLNGDGILSISDVVLLQKWLLAAPDMKLADRRTADLNNDSRLDVFDLCLMRKALLETAEDDSFGT